MKESSHVRQEVVLILLKNLNCLPHEYFHVIHWSALKQEQPVGWEMCLSPFVLPSWSPSWSTESRPRVPSTKKDIEQLNCTQKRTTKMIRGQECLPYVKKGLDSWACSSWREGSGEITLQLSSTWSELISRSKTDLLMSNIYILYDMMGGMV